MYFIFISHSVQRSLVKKSVNQLIKNKGLMIQKHIFQHILYSINLIFFLICDVMGQNHSHVAKRKMEEIYIFSENVKICPFV